MSVQGKLQDISLTNLIQMNFQSGRTGQLRLENAGQQGHIYFNNGDVVHAEYGSHLGKEALYELLAWEDGEFDLEQNLPAPSRTITTHWSDLLLEGLQQLDEHNHPESDQEQEIENSQSVVPDDIAALFGFEKSPNSKESEMAQNIKDILMEMEQEVPGFLASGVVGMDGLGIANYSNNNMDAENINAQMTLLFKLVNTSIDKLKAGTVQDFLLTTDQAYMLVRYLENKDYFLGIAADKNSANLGNMRLISRLFSERLSKAMPH